MSEEITAEETPAVDVPAETMAGDESAPEGAENLGDPGKKALDSMKSKWHTERDKRRQLETELETLRAPKDSPTDQPDLDEIRRQATREALSQANARILRSEVKAIATGKLADPADAHLYLGLDSFEVDENGDVDADEIAEAIQDLLTRKPHLAASRASRFEGTGDGGAARKASGPSQLTRSDLNGMSPQEINQAKKDGRLHNLLSGK